MLLGYSLGGLVAHEMAARLCDEGHRARVVLIDTEPRALQPFGVRTAHYARELKNRLIRPGANGGPARPMLGDIISLIHKEEGGAAGNRLQRQMLGTAASAARRYVPRRSSAPTALLRVGGRPDQTLPDYGWSKVLDHLDVRLVPGNHLSLFKGEHCETFTQELAHAMAKLTAQP